MTEVARGERRLVILACVNADLRILESFEFTDLWLLSPDRAAVSKLAPQLAYGRRLLHVNALLARETAEVSLYRRTPAWLDSIVPANSELAAILPGYSERGTENVSTLDFGALSERASAFAGRATLLVDQIGDLSVLLMELRAALGEAGIFREILVRVPHATYHADGVTIPVLEELAAECSAQFVRNAANSSLFGEWVALISGQSSEATAADLPLSQERAGCIEICRAKDFACLPLGDTKLPPEGAVTEPAPETEEQSHQLQQELEQARAAGEVSHALALKAKSDLKALQDTCLERQTRIEALEAALRAVIDAVEDRENTNQGA